MASETTPLVSKNGSPSKTGGSVDSTAYFLDGVHRRKPSSVGEESFAAALMDEEVDNMPKGGAAAEFNPRPVGLNGSKPPPPPSVNWNNRKMMKHPSIGGGWLNYVSDTWKPKSATAPFASPRLGDMNAGEIGTLVLPRKVPMKVEPKVYLANERTFLAWMHVVVILAVASTTILTYGRDDNIVNQLYGIILLPVSVAFIFYALWQYRRRSYMIIHREPGPFIDIAGPTTLTVILMASIIAQFSMKLHSMMYE